MESKQIAKLFEALSSEARLNVFSLLVKNAPEGLVAGEISQQLSIPATNLSFHLKAIVYSGLVDCEKEGRYMRYKANINLMAEMLTFLTAECCAVYPEQCRGFESSLACGKCK